MPLNVELVEASFEAVAPCAEDMVDTFYATLFAENPEVRPLFPDSMTDQKKKLIASLATIVGTLRRPQELEAYLKKLGARHRDYGATPQRYAVVGSVLLRSLREIAGEQWSDELEDAWSEAYAVVQRLMLEGARDA